MQLIIDNITIDVTKKNIKNINLYVKRPDGHVVITAPYTVSDQCIIQFAQDHLDWIKAKQTKIQQQPKPKTNQYQTGDTLYVFGQPYQIELQYHKHKYAIRLEDGKAILQVRENSTIAQREHYINEWYRSLLKQEIEPLLSQWQQRLDLHAQSWQIKKMKTKWGYCDIGKQKLVFNLQLAQQAQEFLEYVILHELLHLQVPHHGQAFIALLDHHMPQWKEIEQTYKQL